MLRARESEEGKPGKPLPPLHRPGFFTGFSKCQWRNSSSGNRARTLWLLVFSVALCPMSATQPVVKDGGGTSSVSYIFKML